MIRALLHSADDLMNSEGGWWILALDSILLIPLAFAVFFYPIPVLLGVGAALALTIAVLALTRAVHKRTHV